MVAAASVNFEPFSDVLLLDKIAVTQTPGGIHLPENQVSGEDTARARVIKAGPGKLNERGERDPMPVKPGDVVYLVVSGYGLGKVGIDGKEYLIARVSDLIGKCCE